jgi:ribokinase
MSTTRTATPGITVVGSFAVGLTIRASRLPIFGETVHCLSFHTVLRACA